MVIEGLERDIALLGLIVNKRFASIMVDAKLRLNDAQVRRAGCPGTCGVASSAQRRRGWRQLHTICESRGPPPCVAGRLDLCRSPPSLGPARTGTDQR